MDADQGSRTRNPFMKLIGERRGDRRAGLGNPGGAHTTGSFTTDHSDDTDPDSERKMAKDSKRLWLDRRFVPFVSFCKMAWSLYPDRIREIRGNILWPEFGCGSAVSG